MAEKTTKQRAAGKRPYQPPRIIARERLESVAAVCSGPNAKGPGGLDALGQPCGANGGTISS